MIMQRAPKALAKIKQFCSPLPISEYVYLKILNYKKGNYILGEGRNYVRGSSRLLELGGDSRGT